MRQRKGGHHTKPAGLSPAGLLLVESFADLSARPRQGTINGTVNGTVNGTIDGTIISRSSHATLAMTAMYWQAGAAFARINAMEFGYR
jgi:hypothetical protein